MSDGLNKVHLIGNLGREPEMRYTANGNAVTNFPLAVSRSYMKGDVRSEETEWVSVVTWNKLAELLGQHLQKGRKVYVEGRLATRSWEQDGQKKYRTEVVADHVLFLDKAPSGTEWQQGMPNEGDLDPSDLPFD